jgi:cytochrome c
MHGRNFCSGILLVFVLIIGISGFQKTGNTSRDWKGFTSTLSDQPENHKPVVKITEPVKNSIYPWDKQIPYSIEVSDSEDGESKYEEIPVNEVFVRVKFARDEKTAAVYLNKKKFDDTLALSEMMVSNCFNCHAVKTKLAGPSFQEISIRYPLSKANLDRLVNHIKNGSTGIWGTEVMPRHPELTDSAIIRMIKWISAFSNNPGLNYFVGLKGNLILNRPAKEITGGIIIVSAFYTDHGTAANPDRKITGADHLLIRAR